MYRFVQPQLGLNDVSGVLSLDWKVQQKGNPRHIKTSMISSRWESCPVCTKIPSFNTSSNVSGSQGLHGGEFSCACCTCRE